MTDLFASASSTNSDYAGPMLAVIPTAVHNYQNLLFCRVPIHCILGLRIVTKKGVLVGEGNLSTKRTRYPMPSPRAFDGCLIAGLHVLAGKTHRGMSEYQAARPLNQKAGLKESQVPLSK